MPTLKLIAVLAGMTVLPTLLLTQAKAHANGQDSRILSATDVGVIKLRVPFGKVKVLTGGSQIDIKVKRWFDKPGDATAERWVKESRIETSATGGTLTIEELPFGQRDKQSLDAGGDFHPHYELTVTMPPHHGANVNLGAGDITCDGAYRNLEVHLGAGDLKLNSLSVGGACALHVGAGSVTANVVQPLRRSAEIHVGTGSVNLNLHAGTNGSVEAWVGMGEVSGIPGGPKRKGLNSLGDHRKAAFGTGGPQVEIHVGVGSVGISGPNAVASVTDSNELRSETPELSVGVVADKTKDDDGDSADEVAEAVAEKQAAKEEEAVEKQEAKEVDVDAKVDLGLQELDHAMDVHIDEVIDSAINQAMRESKKARTAALRDAQREIERAMRELDQDLARESRAHGSKGNELGIDIDKLVRDAMKTAREAIRTSLNQVRAEQADKD